MLGNSYRIEKIYDLLLIRGKISVDELADTFHVTPTTIRRDLVVMEEKGLASRSRGYAIAVSDTNRKVGLSLFKEEKRRIAQAAKSFVKDGMSVVLDTGDTVRTVVELLMESSDITKLDVVTNSLITGTKLGTRFQVTMPGGMVSARSLALVGLDVESFFSKIYVDVAFLGTTGIGGCTGLTVSNPLHLSVKKNMLACASKKVAVLDSSKFLSRGIFTFCDFEDLDVMITTKTDSNGKMLDEIARKGVELVLV